MFFKTVILSCGILIWLLWLFLKSPKKYELVIGSIYSVTLSVKPILFSEFISGQHLIFCSNSLQQPIIVFNVIIIIIIIVLQTFSSIILTLRCCQLSNFFLSFYIRINSLVIKVLYVDDDIMIYNNTFW